mgnify:CR=1 FL=1
MQTLGERLKQIRTDKNLTQSEFGKLIGVTKQAIANVECGHSNPSIEFLNQLIEIFSLNINWLISGKGEIFSNITKTMGEKISYIKTKNNLSTMQISKALDISESDFNKIINDKKFPDLQVLLKLKHNFNVSMDWLLENE